MEVIRRKRRRRRLVVSSLVRLEDQRLIADIFNSAVKIERSHKEDIRAGISSSVTGDDGTKSYLTAASLLVLGLAATPALA
ncbi:MAG: hypothetical protein KA220_00745, partial [Phenylobacterium sp.]|nr:hypothetical protein [Phenylobacterium sp.]